MRLGGPGSRTGAVRGRSAARSTVRTWPIALLSVDQGRGWSHRPRGPLALMGPGWGRSGDPPLGDPQLSSAPSVARVRRVFHEGSGSKPPLTLRPLPRCGAVRPVHRRTGYALHFPLFRRAVSIPDATPIPPTEDRWRPGPKGSDPTSAGWLLRSPSSLVEGFDRCRRSECQDPKRSKQSRTSERGWRALRPSS